MINHIEKEKAVCEYVTRTTGVTEEQLKSPSKKKEIVEARSLYCYILRAFGWSYPEIAGYVHRDHTTVIHNVGLFEKNDARPRIDAEIKNVFVDALPEGYPQH